MSWRQQEELLSIKSLLEACLQQEMLPFKSENFYFLGHKRDHEMSVTLTLTLILTLTLTLKL